MGYNDCLMPDDFLFKTEIVLLTIIKTNKKKRALNVSVINFLQYIKADVSNGYYKNVKSDGRSQNNNS